MKNRFLLILLVLVQTLFLTTAFAQPLSDVEKQVNDYISQNSKNPNCDY